MYIIYCPNSLSTFSLTTSLFSLFGVEKIVKSTLKYFEINCRYSFQFSLQRIGIYNCGI